MNTGRKKAVLVDRDDTLCPNVPYCDNPSKIHVFPDVPEALGRLKRAGFLVLMVTNQSGIGRGYFGYPEFESVTHELISQIRAGGGEIDDVFFCPHSPDDHCSCRKPDTGMGRWAIEKYDLDPAECWMIGDKDIDLEFGRRLGMKSIRVSAERPFSCATDTILSEIQPSFAAYNK